MLLTGSASSREFRTYSTYLKWPLCIGSCAMMRWLHSQGADAQLAANDGTWQIQILFRYLFLMSLSGGQCQFRIDQILFPRFSHRCTITSADAVRRAVADLYSYTVRRYVLSESSPSFTLFHNTHHVSALLPWYWPLVSYIALRKWLRVAFV